MYIGSDVTGAYGINLFLDSSDYTALWNDLRTKISLVKGSEKPEPGQGMYKVVMVIQCP